MVKKQHKEEEEPSEALQELIDNFEIGDLEDIITESPVFIKLLDAAIENSGSLLPILKYLLDKGAAKLVGTSLSVKAGDDRKAYKKSIDKFAEMAKKTLEDNKIDSTGDAFVLGAYIIAIAGANMKDCSICKDNKKCGKTPEACRKHEEEVPGYG